MDKRQAWCEKHIETAFCGKKQKQKDKANHKILKQVGLK